MIFTLTKLIVSCALPVRVPDTAPGHLQGRGLTQEKDWQLRYVVSILKRKGQRGVGSRSTRLQDWLSGGPLISAKTGQHEQIITRIVNLETPVVLGFNLLIR